MTEVVFLQVVDREKSLVDLCLAVLPEVDQVEYRLVQVPPAFRVETAVEFLPACPGL